MNALVSAAVSDLIGRLVSFLIDKYREHSSIDNGAVVRLQRLLLRARVVIEEAEGRLITNQAMLEQLNQLRRELCRASYTIDAFNFKWRATDLGRSRRLRAMVSRSRWHVRLPPSSGCPDFPLLVMVESLEATLGDMREFVVLLGGCPRINRQPYNAYLFMESCIFGRQMEKEEIIGFLLRSSQDLDVLPIIGPHGIGKHTLVEHVCLDNRVQERFSKIYRLSSDDFDDLHHWSLFDFTAKSLMVIRMVESDADAGESWRRFLSAIYHRVHKGSKILVISRIEEHSILGTVQAVKLHRPHREEIWYFFRALIFGAADPKDYPEHVRLAMALFASIGSNFTTYAVANVVAAALRADLCVRSWCRVLKVFSDATILQLNPVGDRMDKARDGHYHLSRPVKNAPGVSCLFYNTCKFTSVARSDLPKVTILELLTGGSLLPAGETQFEVLVWQSRIPPYESYVVTCDTDTNNHEHVVALKKQLLNKRRRDHQEDDPSN